MNIKTFTIKTFIVTIAVICFIFVLQIVTFVFPTSDVEIKGDNFCLKTKSFFSTENHFDCRAIK